MKKLEKLRLNVLNEQDLKEKQMNSLRGGTVCFCSCYYANYGGSSSEDNRNANHNIGGDMAYSVNGCNQYVYNDGLGYPEYFPDANENTNIGSYG
jgi:natural product precursor